jgi:Rrf2 family transcriptional regulator, cysteine metabolism repressor
MKLSTKVRYATRIMIRLADAKGQASLRKTDIARLEQISPDYVGQILMTLKNAGLVISRRGAQGGFAISRDPAGITVADVLEAVEGPLALVPAARKKEAAEQASVRVTMDLWRRASQALRDALAGACLKDLAREVAALEHATSITFEI